MSKRFTINSVFYVLLGLFWLSCAASAAAQSSLLDGRSYVGHSEEKHKNKVAEDELRFINGKFHSMGFERKGFLEGVYSATTVADKIFFKAKTISPKLGDISWSGIVVGDTIKANYRWLKRGWLSDTEKVYSFNGTLKK